jgi:hypothetical protein
MVEHQHKVQKIWVQVPLKASFVVMSYLLHEKKIYIFTNIDIFCKVGTISAC